MRTGSKNGTRRFYLLLGSLLITVGLSLFLAVTALYAYGAYERYRFEQSPVAQVAAEAVESGPVAEAEAPTSSQDDPPSVVQTPFLSYSVPEPAVSTSTLQEPSRQPPATRIRIPKIEVDSAVVESPIKNGEWQVPKFVVGHLEGTANPGEVGNVAFSGHLESIASGNVFSRLKEAAVGDDVTLLVGATEFRYTVAEVKVVKRDDLSVVMPTSEPIVTLITCAGTWSPLTRDYSERLIVVAKPGGQGRTG